MRQPIVECLFILTFCFISSSCLLAGPPFVTDDPEPVELHHWEVYISSLQVTDPSGTTGTLPHVEVNNGVLPDMQLHIIVPYAFSRPVHESTTRGIGMIELGMKYRFIQETKRRPMVGIFPLIEVPTGRRFGTGHTQFFLPIWIQKSWDSWTSYGGGGYFINPGLGNRSFWLFGWEIQKDLNEHLTLGGEIFETTSASAGAPNELNFNLGGYYNFDEGHHLLFSAGRSILGDIKFMSYFGYQWTFGPKSTEEESGPKPPTEPPTTGAQAPEFR